MQKKNHSSSFGMVYFLISGSPATPRFSIPHSLAPRSILKKPATQSKHNNNNRFTAIIQY